MQLMNIRKIIESIEHELKDELRDNEFYTATLYVQLENLIKLHKDMRINNEWNNNIETAPKNGDVILLYASGDIGICYWRDDIFDEIGNGWTWGFDNRFNNPTKWKSLPN